MDDIDYCVIFTISESGCSDSWTFQGEVSRNANGTFNCLIFKESDSSSDEVDLDPLKETLQELESGAELFEFVQDIWRQENCDSPSVEFWREAVLELEGFDRALANELAQAIIDHECDDIGFSGDDNAVTKHVRMARWQKKDFGGGGGIWAAIGNHRLAETAVAYYVKKYIQAKGHLPFGEHHINVLVGESKNDDCLAPPYTTHGRFNQKVIFPEQ